MGDMIEGIVIWTFDNLVFHIGIFLFLPLGGLYLCKMLLRDFLLRQYGSSEIADEILQARTLRQKLSFYVPRRHVQKRSLQYSITRLIGCVFRLDFWFTALMIVLTYPTVSQITSDDRNLMLVLFAAVKGAFEIIPILYANSLFWTDDFGSYSEFVAELEENRTQALAYLEQVRTTAPEEWKDGVTQEEMDQIAAELTEALEDMDENEQRMREKFDFAVYDGNPH